MRLAVYCDYSYRVDDGVVFAELPFALFVRELASRCERLVVTGRLDPGPGRYPYAVGAVEYAPLPHYVSGAQIGTVLGTLPAAGRRFWRLLDDVDVAWILGPNPPQALLFALMAKVRGRRLVLGIRQNLPELIGHRHAGKPLVRIAAAALETAFRLLARTTSVVVVGPDLAHRYRAAAELHVAYVSLVTDGDILAAEEDRRDYGGDELRILSVGRLDPEKNPLLLADVLARALETDPRWRLHVCGDGPLLPSLRRRLHDLGLTDRAVLHGYVPIDAGLWELYRQSHALLHVSLSEGVPQVVLEAFAARLPVVATAVGGVAEVVSGLGLLVAPGDAGAAARALGRLACDAALRTGLIDRAAAMAREHTLSKEAARLVAFLAGGQSDARAALTLIDGRRRVARDATVTEDLDDGQGEDPQIERE